MPAVLKPADSGGQRGIFYVESQDELDAHVHAALAESPTEEAIVEGFHDGLELNGIVIARGGEAFPLTLSDRLRPPGIGFGVGWIHVYPASIYADVLAEAERVAVHAVHALGLRDGIAFPQLIVSDDGSVRVVEVAARIPGGQMADLVRHAVGVDLVEVALRQALGEEIPDELVLPHFKQPLAIRFLTAQPGPLPTGKVLSVGPLDPVLAAPGVVQADTYLQVGETIRPVRLDGDRRGYVIAIADTTVEALQRATPRALEVGSSRGLLTRRRGPGDAHRRSRRVRRLRRGCSDLITVEAVTFRRARTAHRRIHAPGGHRLRRSPDWLVEIARKSMDGGAGDVSCAFDLDHYRELLDAAKAGGYRFAFFEGEPREGDLILRHDVDLSLDAALRMAELEADAGAAATYFLMTGSVFYNLGSEEGERALGRLRELGHRVGLHAVYPRLDLDERFDPVIAWHNPDPEYMRAPVEGAINVMEAPWFDPETYRSDSNQHWRSGCPHEELRDGAFPWLQLLTHPEIWVYPGTRMGETMRAMLEEEKERRLEQLAADRIDLS